MRLLQAFACALAAAALSGCVVVTVAGAAVSVAATVVGTAVDVAVGTVKVAGRAIGSAVDAVGDAGEAEAKSPPQEPKPSK